MSVKQSVFADRSNPPLEQRLAAQNLTPHPTPLPTPTPPHPTTLKT